ncbi:FG-GAP-like repeat-containing protein [Georgenia faecalis]|uniref:FG-GAP-like repeat-containing protein n=1 Tax=Georgenia faecalis TaxID=2483799 RepID=UPI000FD95606|nr:FG-GAP-like repeat-containing protein [Georgenia faecalis]
MHLSRPRPLVLLAVTALALGGAVPAAAAAGGADDGPPPAATVPDARPVTPEVDLVALAPARDVPDGLDDVAAFPSAAARTTAPRVSTATTATASEVAVAGVTWPAGDTDTVTGVYLRSRTGRTWSAWEAVEVTPDEDLPESSTGGTEPIAVIGADDVEVAVLATGPVPEATLAVWDPGESEADAQAALPADAGAGGARAAAPTIFSRADWGADESVRFGEVSSNSVRGVVVHHTAGSNSYSAAQVPGIIRGIYSFHAITRGWGDVGYNVLVDKFGRAWEGRYGSRDQAIWGAHASPYNSTMFGISVMGNFDQVAVPEAAMTTVARVTAWMFDRHGIPARGRTTIDGVTLDRVVGHRDVASTSCPGQYFYPRLDELTDRIAAYQTDLGDRSLDRDLTGDGVPDVVARVGDDVRLAAGTRGDGLVSGGRVGTAWDPARTIDAGDWDGNGTGDLMLTDAAGRLWFYAGLPGGGWAAQRQIGQGWQIVDLVAAGHDWDGDGDPDLLARRTADGTLWLYPGNGSGGFAAARQVGQGWGVMNLLAMVGTPGAPALAARTAAGELRIYRGDGAGGFEPAPTVAGSGWQVMRTLVGVGDRTGDGVGDVLALDTGGTLWQYPGSSRGGFGARTAVTTGWGGVRAAARVLDGAATTGLLAVGSGGDLVRWTFGGDPGLRAPAATGVRLASSDLDVTPVGDWDGDGLADLAVRQANGNLMLHRGTGAGRFAATGTRVGTGWAGFEAIAGAGDWVGDGTPGILGYDEDTGDVWLYPGTGDGAFRRRIEIGDGLDGYDAFINAGHWSGSGVPDLLMRGDTSRNLFLWPGNGPGLLLDRRQVGQAWGGMVHLVGVGDLDGDTVPDVLAVDGARRTWLYPGTGDGGFQAAVELGPLAAGVTALS